MNLTHVNLDCLLSIFAYLPPTQQLVFRLISNTWSSLLQLCLRHRRRHEPLILFSKDAHVHLERYSRSLNRTVFSTKTTNPLIVSCFTQHHPAHLFTTLHRLFPFLRNLAIFLPHSSTLPTRARLYRDTDSLPNWEPLLFDALDIWKYSLTTINLNYIFEDTTHLWTTLASLPHLVNLHLESTNSQDGFPAPFATVMSRLKVFSTHSLYDSGALDHFGPNLTHFSLKFPSDIFWNNLGSSPTAVKTLTFKCSRDYCFYGQRTSLIVSFVSQIFPQLECLQIRADAQKRLKEKCTLLAEMVGCKVVEI